MFSKNLKFATKNKSGTAQIDNIGDMRATLKLLRLLVSKAIKSVGRVTKANVPRSLGVPAKWVPQTDADETSLCRIDYGERSCEC